MAGKILIRHRKEIKGSIRRYEVDPALKKDPIRYKALKRLINRRKKTGYKTLRPHEAAQSKIDKYARYRLKKKLEKPPRVKKVKKIAEKKVKLPKIPKVPKQPKQTCGKNQRLTPDEEYRWVVDRLNTAIVGDPSLTVPFGVDLLVCILNELIFEYNIAQKEVERVVGKIESDISLKDLLAKFGI